MISTFKEIADYHKAMGRSPEGLSMEQRMEMLREYAIGAIHELVEAMQHTPWKTWKLPEKQDNNPILFAGEMADVLFFIAGMCEVMEITPRNLHSAYIEKLVKNYHRLEPEGDHIRKE